MRRPFAYVDVGAQFHGIVRHRSRDFQETVHRLIVLKLQHFRFFQAMCFRLREVFSIYLIDGANGAERQLQETFHALVGGEVQRIGRQFHRREVDGATFLVDGILLTVCIDVANGIHVHGLSSETGRIVPIVFCVYGIAKGNLESRTPFRLVQQHIRRTFIIRAIQGGRTILIFKQGVC